MKSSNIHKHTLTATCAIVIAVLLIMITRTAAYASANLVKKGYETCGAIKGDLEVLFPAPHSICQPGADNGRIAIIIASNLPVFAYFEAKRAWFLASVAIVGRDARDAGLTQFSTLYMMDADSAHSLQAYAMPITKASQLQQEVKSDQLSSDDYVKAVMSDMNLTELPQRLLRK